jgi:hypothetical protein
LKPASKEKSLRIWQLIKANKRLTINPHTFRLLLDGSDTGHTIKYFLERLQSHNKKLQKIPSFLSTLSVLSIPPELVVNRVAKAKLQHIHLEKKNAGYKETVRPTGKWLYTY